PAPWNSLGSVASLGIGYLKLPVASGIGAAGPGKAQYQVTGYWQSGSATRLEFGVTDTDHVIVLFEATCSSNSTSCLALVELTANGGQLRFVQFPSATMPDVVHVTPTGEVVMAGKLDHSIGFGATPIDAVEHGFYVAKLDRDWRQEFAFAVSTDRDYALNRIFMGRDGAVYTAVGEAEPKGPSGSEWLIAYRADATELRRWSAFHVDCLAGTASGSVLAAGWRRDNREIGDVSLPPASGRDGVLFTFDATTGEATPILTFGGVDDDEITVVSESPNGEIRLGGKVGRDEMTFAAAWNASTEPKAFLAQLDRSAQITYAAPLEDVTVISDLVHSADAAFVAGYLVPNGLDPTTESRLLLGKLSSRGQPEAIVAFDSQAPTLGRIGVDSKGTIWLSGFGQISLDEPKVVSAVYRIEQR
ncbi:MAG TPA: hypothetical protein VKP30_03495, partial [Polyangiaceae bacterium]|nr:hypothetical protein [Polyangiaceae bacterium]